MLQLRCASVFFPSDTLIYGICRDGTKNDNIRACEHLILGQFRMGARSAIYAPLIDGLFYLAGGNTYPDGLTTEVLVWDPAAEVWMVAGQLESARQRHALASVSLQLLTSVAPGCSLDF